MHDDRCEADWNDGTCACVDRADNASHGFFRESPEPTSTIRRIARRLKLHS